MSRSDPGGDCPCKKGALALNIFSASLYGDVSRVRHLLSDPAHHRSPDICDEYGYTPLILAAQRGHLSIVELLLEHGASICASESGRCTPLHRAAFSGHLHVVDALLRSRGGTAVAVLDALDGSTGDGRTALAKAASQGHDAVVRRLLAAGANAELCDARGMSPAHVAAAAGFPVIAALLPAAAAQKVATS